MATAVGSASSRAGGDTCTWPSFRAFEENARRARRAAVDVRHATGLAAGTALEVRHHPLMVIGLAAAAGALAGCVVGCAAGWFARRRG